MKNQTLKFIGRGSAFNVKEGNTSSYVKNGSHLMLIDCGSDVFKNLLEKNILKDVSEVDVLLTHMHPDHFGSLGDLIFYTYFKMGVSQMPSITIHHKSENLTRTLETLGVYSFMYFESKFSSEFKGEHRKIKDYLVKPVEVEHYQSPLTLDNPFDTIGFKLVINNKNIYYSGDAHSIPNQILNSLLNLEFDEFYQDTCALDYQGNPHLSYKKLKQIIPRQLRESIFIMHIDESFDINQAENDGFNVVVKEIKENHNVETSFIIGSTGTGKSVLLLEKGLILSKNKKILYVDLDAKEESIRKLKDTNFILFNKTEDMLSFLEKNTHINRSEVIVMVDHGTKNLTKEKIEKIHELKVNQLIISFEVGGVNSKKEVSHEDLKRKIEKTFGVTKNVSIEIPSFHKQKH